MGLMDYLAGASLDKLLDRRPWDDGGAIARCLAGPTAGGTGQAKRAAVLGKAVAAAEAAGGGPAARDIVGQRLAASRLDMRFPRLARPQRVPIRDATRAACYLALPPAPEAPALFRIEPCGLLVSLHAGKGSPFFFHVDHRQPVACGGPTTLDNLVALQWRANLAKSDRWAGRADAWTGAWTAAEVNQVPARHMHATNPSATPAAVLAACLQGLEPTVYNVERVLWDRAPWSAAPASTKQAAALRVQRAAAARRASRRSRQLWHEAEELQLARAVLQQEQEAAGIGARVGICWCTVAATLPGRDPVQCKDKWASLKRSWRQHGGEGTEQEDTGDAEGEQHQSDQWALRAYQRWEDDEVGDLAMLLGALGEHLAGAAGDLQPSLRHLPGRLDSVCREVFEGERLPAVFPGRSEKQAVKRVVDKCTGLVETAVKLALNVILNPGGQSGITPKRWEQLAPRLPLLAAELPIDAGLKQRAASGEGAARIWRFILDPPGNGALAAALAEPLASELVDLTLSDSEDDEGPAQHRRQLGGQPAAAEHGPARQRGSQLSLRSSNGSRSVGLPEALSACHQHQHQHPQLHSGAALRAAQQHQCQPGPRPVQPGREQEVSKPARQGGRASYTQEQRDAVEAGVREFWWHFNIYCMIKDKYGGPGQPLEGLGKTTIKDLARPVVLRIRLQLAAQEQRRQAARCTGTAAQQQ
ncbi:hypothetical protein ABPG75_012067 [Micractinium tetrahymenae]